MALNPKDDMRVRVLMWLALLAGVLLLLTGPEPQAHGEPRMGWICTGPPNVMVGGLAHVAPGRIECAHRSCGFILARRPWCPRNDPRRLVREVFGARGAEAIQVAWCESRFYPYAGSLSTHHGVLQMGVAERATYGSGGGAKAQLLAARSYFVASGSDWSPWQCRPAAGVVV